MKRIIFFMVILVLVGCNKQNILDGLMESDETLVALETECDCKFERTFFKPEIYPDKIPESIKEFSSKYCNIAISEDRNSIDSWLLRENKDHVVMIYNEIYKRSNISIYFIKPKPYWTTNLVLECFGQKFNFQISYRIYLDEISWEKYIKKEYNIPENYIEWKRKVTRNTKLKAKSLKNLAEGKKSIIKINRLLIDYIDKRI